MAGIQNADVGHINLVLPGTNFSTAPMLIAVADYAKEIYVYLKNREKDFPIRDYMTDNAILCTKRRSTIVEYMAETRRAFVLQHATLYLGVKILDLCLSRMDVKREKQFLLAFTAIYIASKYNESKPPPQINYLLKDCTPAETFCMEKQILLELNFSLGIPVSYNFLEHTARCAKVSPKTYALACYTLEMSLMNYECVSFSDSKLAAAALFLALRMCENKTWSSFLIYYTDYRLGDFVELVPVLNRTLRRRYLRSYDTICKKYSHSKYFKVAKLPLLSDTQLLTNN